MLSIESICLKPIFPTLLKPETQVLGTQSITNDGATQLGKKNQVEKATFRAPPEGGSSCKNNISTRAGGQLIRLLSISFKYMYILA